MSESGPDPSNTPDPQHARWVKATVVGDEQDPPLATIEEAPAPIPVPDQPPVTEEELQGARWFAIAFLVLVIPLGLVLLTLIVWAFIRSIPL